MRTIEQKADPPGTEPESNEDRAADQITESAPPGELTKDNLAEVINSVVFESGILAKVIRSELDERLKEATAAVLDSYLKRELPKFLNEHVSKAVAESLGSEEVKLLIDSKFRAITLYLKTDVIPRVVKQILQKAGN